MQNFLIWTIHCGGVTGCLYPKETHTKVFRDKGTPGLQLTSQLEQMGVYTLGVICNHWERQDAQMIKGDVEIVGELG